jgi:uroporphyrinogen decarboxylase
MNVMVMNHKERFLATIERRPVDRPAAWLGMPVSAALPGLFRHFQVKDIEELKRKLDDDLWPVDVPYHSPTANHIACAFDWAKEGQSNYEERTLTTPGFFEDYVDCADPKRIDDFQWPDPSKYMNSSECRAAVKRAPGDFAIMGVLWSAHFQDALAAFGMGKALIAMLRNPKFFQAVIDRITEFYLAANEIFFKASEGLLDCVLIGNDFGGQKGLMFNPRLIRKFVLSGTKALIDQAKEYNVKVIHHSCGSIHPLIHDLIEVGADAIHPIQALAADMDAATLKRDYGSKVSFCGGVDAQFLLVTGQTHEVAAKVKVLKQIFPTGLILSPSHEAIMPDTKPENIEALFWAVKK